MRIAIDLQKWEETPQNIQEIIIGRDKLTGCPLVRVDSKYRPVRDTRCPVIGTSEVIDPGNEYFRDHPPFTTSPLNKVLQQSHIGSNRPLDKIPIWDKRSLRIYRQGFEFLQSTMDPPHFEVGLNFVSFQNTPERLHRTLSYQHIISQKTRFDESMPTLDQYFYVLAAGIFLAPPVKQDEPFPGADIFLSPKDLNNLGRKW
jgi:deferrochelatase/peroxidase EfeB